MNKSRDASKVGDQPVINVDDDSIDMPEDIYSNTITTHHEENGTEMGADTSRNLINGE